MGDEQQMPRNERYVKHAELAVNQIFSARYVAGADFAIRRHRTIAAFDSRLHLSFLGNER